MLFVHALQVAEVGPYIGVIANFLLQKEAGVLGNACCVW
jgi:hypothetical protein